MDRKGDGNLMTDSQARLVIGRAAVWVTPPLMHTMAQCSSPIIVLKTKQINKPKNIVKSIFPSVAISHITTFILDLNISALCYFLHLFYHSSEENMETFFLLFASDYSN